MCIEQWDMCIERRDMCIEQWDMCIERRDMCIEQGTRETCV